MGPGRVHFISQSQAALGYCLAGLAEELIAPMHKALITYVLMLLFIR